MFTSSSQIVVAGDLSPLEARPGPSTAHRTRWQVTDLMTIFWTRPRISSAGASAVCLRSPPIETRTSYPQVCSGGGEGVGRGWEGWCPVGRSANDWAPAEIVASSSGEGGGERGTGGVIWWRVYPQRSSPQLSGNMHGYILYVCRSAIDGSIFFVCLRYRSSFLISLVI